jgi:hypothetical protein
VQHAFLVYEEMTDAKGNKSVVIQWIAYTSLRAARTAVEEDVAGLAAQAASDREEEELLKYEALPVSIKPPTFEEYLEQISAPDKAPETPVGWVDSLKYVTDFGLVYTIIELDIWDD